MRTKNVLMNSIYSLSYQMLLLIVGILIPRYIISIYGAEVNGLISNINQIITILNLLQAGLVGASIFEMYKPIANNDYETIGKIYFSSKNYFNKISYLFFGLSLCIIPYLLFLTNTSLKPFDIILSVSILGISAAGEFRFVCSYDIIFSSFQKRYILMIGGMIEKGLYYVILFFVLSMRLHYIFMYLAMLFSAVIKWIYLKYMFKNSFAINIETYKSKINYKVKNQFKLLGNQVIQNIIEASPILLISINYGLEYASVLSIYLMVSNVFRTVLSALINAVSASFGDLAASDNKRLLKVFDCIQYLCLLMALAFFIPMVSLVTPFTRLYIGIRSDIQYAYIGLGICITLYVCTYTQYMPFNMLVNSLGLYGKVYKGNIVIGIISTISTVVCCFIDFQLTYIGIICFYILSILHRFIVVKKSGILLKINNLVRGIFPIIIIMLFAFFSNYLLNMIQTWLNWLCYGFGVVILSLIIVMLYSVIFDIDQFKMFVGYLKNVKKKDDLIV